MISAWRNLMIYGSMQSLRRLNMTKHWHDLTPMAWNTILGRQAVSQQGLGRAFLGQQGLHPARDPRRRRHPGPAHRPRGTCRVASAFRCTQFRRQAVHRPHRRRAGPLQTRCRTYPSTEQGLAALVQKPGGVDNWNGPYLKGDALPVDPWNRPYAYRSPSERTGHDFDLCSLGASGNAGQGSAICNP